MTKVELGQKAKDLITGFEGIAVYRGIRRSGVDRISLQPGHVLPDGKLPESQDFDETQLVVTDANRLIAVEPLKVECDFGDEATYRFADFKGKVVSIVYYVNGCARIGLQREVDKKEKFLPELKYFDYGDLEFTKAKPVEVTNRSKTGGPSDGPRDRLAPNAMAIL